MPSAARQLQWLTTGTRWHIDNVGYWASISIVFDGMNSGFTSIISHSGL
jgi:hypothetical protein